MNTRARRIPAIKAHKEARNNNNKTTITAKRHAGSKKETKQCKIRKANLLQGKQTVAATAKTTIITTTIHIVWT